MTAVEPARSRLVRRRGGGTRIAGAWCAIGLVVILAMAGCGKRGRPEVPSTPAQRAQALIEAGNQAYTAGNHGLAARRYAAAAVIRNDDPAAYYGLGMALSKLGRDEDARAAYARARELAQRAPAGSP
jgi:Tfp pilus assembly protein PilF